MDEFPVEPHAECGGRLALKLSDVIRARTTYLVLRQVLPWGQEEIAVPLSDVAYVDAAGMVHLKISEAELNSRPALLRYNHRESGTVPADCGGSEFAAEVGSPRCQESMSPTS